MLSKFLLKIIFMKKKTVNTYFVFKACSLCRLFFENRYPYVNEVLVYIKTILSFLLVEGYLLEEL